MFHFITYLLFFLYKIIGVNWVVASLDLKYNMKVENQIVWGNFQILIIVTYGFESQIHNLIIGWLGQGTLSSCVSDYMCMYVCI